MSEPIACRKRWIMLYAYASCNLLFISLVLFALFAFPQAPLYIKVGAIILILFFLYIIITAVRSFLTTTLYIFPDGLGVKYKAFPVRFIYWDNIEPVRGYHDSPINKGLVFRVKSYNLYLSQFTDIEINHQLSIGRIYYSLLGWTFFDRKLLENKDVLREVISMREKSPMKKLGLRMLRIRNENGYDLIAGASLCSSKDFSKIQTNYADWLRNQPR